MPMGFRTRTIDATPTDTADLMHQEHHERQAQIQWLQAEADRLQARSDELLTPTAATSSAGRTAALGVLGALGTPLAVGWFSVVLRPLVPDLPGLAPAGAWVVGLVAAGLLASGSPVPQAAVRRGTASRHARWLLPLVAVATVVIVWLTSVTVHAGERAAISALLSGCLLVLPRFTVDEMARRRGRRLRVAADQLRSDAAYLSGVGDGSCGCPNCATREE